MTMPASRPERMPRLADRLAVARRRRFVGRAAELEIVRSALAAAEPPFSLLHLHGPGGVGKTTLLGEYARLAGEAGIAVVQLDGRDIEPSPPGFLTALRLALGLAEADSPLERLALPARRLLLIDAYEALAPLDAWLRETFLPQLPAHSLIVIAGRNPPTTAWRTDIAWADLTRVVTLGNLPTAESHAYLTACGVPPDRHAEALAFTHGHPLALALVADALTRGDALANVDPHDQPDIVRLLLERLLNDIPSAAHRLALEVCALALVTTEALLAEVVGADQAPALFAWLRRLTFIEQGPRGLVPHDLAREALDAEARWRDLEGYRRVAYRLYAHLHARIAQVSGSERQRLLLDALYVIRVNPHNTRYFDWLALDGVYAEPAAADDAEAIVAMVRAHEGDASARIAEHWLRRQPDAFLVFRTIKGEPFGFMAHLALHEATPADADADPAVAAAVRFVLRYGPARPGEAILHLRFWMGRETHQAITAAINLTAMNVVGQCVTHPSLAWNFTTMADPDFWLPHFTGINWPRAPEADFEVGGRRYGAFAHDWRVEPAAAWVAGNRATPMPHAASPRGSSPPAPVLSQEQFAEAARQALRDFTRPDRLAANPLARSRLVRDAGPPSPAILQALIREAASALATNPKDQKFHRAVWRTYIEPAPTQERAAELLGLPFNTYRYRLAKGIERVTERLWRREVAGADG